MTEIEQIELEIAEKRALLKVLKERANPRLRYGSFTDALNAGVEVHSFAPEIIDALRVLALRVAGALYKTNIIRGKFITTHGKIMKVKNLSPEQVRILNSMLDEIGPIVARYVLQIASNNECVDCYKEE